jgi:hypothetical protein
MRGRTVHILSVRVPSLHSATIRPFVDDFDGVCFRNLCVDDLGILGVLRGRELHVLDVRERHLVFRTLRGEVVLRRFGWGLRTTKR